MSKSGPSAAPSSYRGRFAPTPSGPLHLGSLLTALASWLQARSAGGRWLLRIDDLDRARCPADAEAGILRQLELHGLYWDESLRRQSAHVEEYLTALDALRNAGHTYVCKCTRAVLAADSRTGPDGPVYSGRCRSLALASGPGRSLRYQAPDQELLIIDAVQGRLSRHGGRDLGDCVLRRADGLIGYQLACVVDDQCQAISEVVRGFDLLGSSFQQCLLRKALGQVDPQFMHLPVLLGPDGRKLSKQNGAAALGAESPSGNLAHCLRLLGQQPPHDLAPSGVPSTLRWAVANWRPRNIPRRPGIGTEPD